MSDSLGFNLPQGLAVEKTLQGFKILRHWTYGWQDKAQEVLKAIFGVCLVGVAAWIIMSGQFNPTIYLLCMAPISLVGIGLIYHALAYLVNTDLIVASPDGFSNTHRPLPAWWNKNVNYLIDEIDRVEIATKTYEARQRKETENTYHTYDIVIFTNTGRPKPLVAGMYNVIQARYILSVLANYLRELRPEEIPGEME